MSAGAEGYRKLPGRRRGLIQGASLWMGSDHLLSVQSMRFREQYKRFYLRDVQAIVVARAPRFLVSTPVILTAVLWGIVMLSVRGLTAWLSPYLWVGGALLLGIWIYVSAAQSCRCRIYTAVSRDELPSVYRMWKARKFLAAIEPRILEVQGVLAGDWADAVEERTIGPTAVPKSPAGAGIKAAGAARRSRTWATDLFLASLLVDAVLNLMTLHRVTTATQWTLAGMNCAEIGCAVVILQQHYRGVLRTGMQRLAIAALLTMGAALYARQAILGITGNGQTFVPDPAVLSSQPGYIVIREAYAGACLVLAVVGAALVLIAGWREPDSTGLPG